jgi:sialate O-acetylesterase
VFTARAEVKPYPLCTDGMVLQQQTDAKIWGTADPGEKVTVAFRGRKASATADPNGRWLVTIASGEAGGPFELGITGKNTLAYKNVLVGEVWLCSGQSNIASEPPSNSARLRASGFSYV